MQQESVLKTGLILLALVLGLSLGMAWVHYGWDGRGTALQIADLIGGLWIDGLRMTIVPLIVALLVTGIARTADEARGGNLAFQSVGLFVVLLWVATALAAVLVPLLLERWPLSSEAANALKSGIKTSGAVAAQTPDTLAFLRSIIPTNPLAAAVDTALLPLIFFTSVFAVAVTRLAADARAPIVSFFSSVADAMLVVVGWVLWIAPVGVFALALTLGVNAGTAAIGALLHYIVIVTAAGFVAWFLAYPLALFGGRVPLGRFIAAVVPAQAVALSTQSSLATLPTMLKVCERLGISTVIAGVALPIAVAIFRITSPGMNLAVAIYVAHWFGIPLSPANIIAGAVVAGTTTLGTVSLPGQASFLTSVTPIAVAMGVPLEPLALLLAVEMIPDLVRTVGNVTMDVAATSTIARFNRPKAEAAE
jgi:proton glutamate symport protein